MITFVVGSLVTAYILGFVFGYGQLAFKKFIEVATQ